MDFDFILPDSATESISEIFEDSPPPPSSRNRSTSCPRSRPTSRALAAGTSKASFTRGGKPPIAAASASTSSTAHAGHLRNRQLGHNEESAGLKAIKATKSRYKRGEVVDPIRMGPSPVRSLSPSWEWDSPTHGQLDLERSTRHSDARSGSFQDSPLSSSPEAGLMDVVSTVVHGFSSFGLQATNLLNTLDANFDQIFNPLDSPDYPPRPNPDWLQPGRKPGSSSADVSDGASSCSSQGHHPYDGVPRLIAPATRQAESPASPAKLAAMRQYAKRRDASTVHQLISPVPDRPNAQKSRVSVNLLSQLKRSHPAPGEKGSLSVAAAGPPLGAHPLSGRASPSRAVEGPSAEVVRLYDEVARLKQEVEFLSERNAKLVEENSRLSTGEVDPVDLTIRKQLESLLSEKAALMEKNSRLERENDSLQELLDFATEHPDLLFANAQTASYPTPYPQALGYGTTGYGAGGVGGGQLPSSWDLAPVDGPFPERHTQSEPSSPRRNLASAGADAFVELDPAERAAALLDAVVGHAARLSPAKAQRGPGKHRAGGLVHSVHNSPVHRSLPAEQMLPFQQHVCSAAGEASGSSCQYIHQQLVSSAAGASPHSSSSVDCATTSQPAPVSGRAPSAATRSDSWQDSTQPRFSHPSEGSPKVVQLSEEVMQVESYYSSFLSGLSLPPAPDFNSNAYPSEQRHTPELPQRIAQEEVATALSKPDEDEESQGRVSPTTDGLADGADVSSDAPVIVTASDWSALGRGCPDKMADAGDSGSCGSSLDENWASPQPDDRYGTGSDEDLDY